MTTNINNLPNREKVYVSDLSERTRTSVQKYCDMNSISCENLISFITHSYMNTLAQELQHHKCVDKDGEIYFEEWVVATIENNIFSQNQFIVDNTDKK